MDFIFTLDTSLFFKIILTPDNKKPKCCTNYPVSLAVIKVTYLLKWAVNFTYHLTFNNEIVKSFPHTPEPLSFCTSKFSPQPLHK